MVAARTCVQALELSVGDGVWAAESAQSYVQQIERLLADEDLARGGGLDARACVVRRFSWEAHLSVLDEDLGPLLGSNNPRAVVPVT